MSGSLLLVIAGTRAELIACAPLLETIRGVRSHSLPFTPRLVLTGQESTELVQTVDALGIVPDVDLGIKENTIHLADADMNAQLLSEITAVLRNRVPSAILVAGYSASAWAGAIAAYFKKIPLIHLDAGLLSLPGIALAFPEFLHGEDIVRFANLHLCADAAAAETVRQRLQGAPGGRFDARIEVTGRAGGDVLVQSLLALPGDGLDPTLDTLRPAAPRVVVFLRRREHHASALRPMALALGVLAEKHPDYEFIVLHSLQAHICDALCALLPKCHNIHGISPLPHPAFVRELRRARLVLSDSHGVAMETVALARPLILIGDYVRTASLDAAPTGRGQAPFTTVAMDEDAIVEASETVLSQDSPPSVPDMVSDGVGEKCVSAIVDWWHDYLDKQTESI